MATPDEEMLPGMTASRTVMINLVGSAQAITDDRGCPKLDDDQATHCINVAGQAVYMQLMMSGSLEEAVHELIACVVNLSTIYAEMLGLIELTDDESMFRGTPHIALAIREVVEDVWRRHESGLN